MSRARIVSALVLLFFFALAGWTFSGLSVRSSISDFVPTAEGEEDLESLTRALTDSPASRTIALTLGPTDQATAARAGGMLGERLRAVPGVATVEDGAPENIDQAFYELYFSRRYAFFADRAEDVPAMVTDEALGERARELRRALGGPTAMLVRRIAPEDPLQVFPRVMLSLRGEPAGDDRSGDAAILRSGPRLVDEHLVVDDPLFPEGARSFGVVLLTTEGTTFSADAQEPVLLAIEAAFVEVRDELGADELLIEQASVHRFAVRAERQLRADTSFISVVSMIGIVVLFLVLFRGPRYLLLGGIPLFVGTVAAAAFCRLVFGGVHGITLAFGSSMLGVGIDFSGHYVGHHVLEPDPAGPYGTMKRIWPGLLLGAGTTVLGLLGLGLTSLPGMQELAVFSAVGVFGALLATRFLVPPFMPEKPRATRLHVALAAKLDSILGWISRTPRVGMVALVLAVVVSAIGLPQLEFVDDLRALNDTDPLVAAEDRLVRARVAQGEPGRFAVAIGETEEDALVRAEAMHRALLEARREGELASFRSITSMVRSEATQRAVLEALTADRSLPARTLTALEGEGFVPSMFSPFATSLEVGAAEPPLTFSMLATGSTAPLVRPFRLDIPADEAHPAGRVAFIALLSGIEDSEALSERLSALPGVLLFDQGAYLRAAYGTFRRRATELVLGGLLMVLALCWGRYRDLRRALAALTPAALASTTTPACVALSGQPANLMHLVACLLVLSMGEDYAVFLLESRDEPRGPATTMVGLLLACTTTVLSFGLLAVSSHPALRALGVVTSLGVLLSLILSPLGLFLAAGGSRAHTAAEASGR